MTLTPFMGSLASGGGGGAGQHIGLPRGGTNYADLFFSYQR